MNSDLFSYYLIDTSKLREIGYQDLEILIEKFPYCQNLHFLVAKKSHIEDHPDFEKWLNKAATYSTDRAYLYQLLHEVDFQKDYIFEGEKFDLGEIAPQKEIPAPEVVFDLENEKNKAKEAYLLTEEKDYFEMENANETAVPLPAIATIIPSQNTDNQQITDEEEYEKPLVTLSDLMKQNEEETPKEEEEKLMTFSDLMHEEQPEKAAVKEEDDEPLMTFEELLKQNEILENTEIEEKAAFILPENTEPKKEESELETVLYPMKKTLKPTPKSAFSSWKKSDEISIGETLNHGEEILKVKEKIEKRMESEEDKKKRKDEKKKKKQEGIVFVDKSLIPDESIATETLAKILALQGRKDEAISMFEKLKLQMPEKSTFFAAEIEKLK